MNTQLQRRNTDGFTIIEAMISMFFIAFIVGEMAMVSGYAANSSSYARRLTEANMLADAVLEQSRNTTYVNLNTRFSSLDATTVPAYPGDAIKFDLNKDGTAESYDETCTPATPDDTTLSVVCESNPGITVGGATVLTYKVKRTVASFRPTTSTPFNSSTGTSSTAATVDVEVSWVDSRGGAQAVRVSTVRAKDY